MDRSAGVYYAPVRICKLVIATMKLHNICIEHGLQWEDESPVEIDEDEEIFLLDSMTSGHAVRLKVVADYFNWM